MTAAPAPPAVPPSTFGSDRSASAQAGRPGDDRGPEAAALKNPVPATPASIAAGKSAFDVTCAACHGNGGQGAVKAGS